MLGLKLELTIIKKKCVGKWTSVLVVLRNISTRTCSFKYQEWHADCQYCRIQADTTKDMIVSIYIKLYRPYMMEERSFEGISNNFQVYFFSGIK